MATLAQYLSDKPKAAFAKRVGIAPVYLSQILGGRRPGYDLMVRIREATDGAVGLETWADHGPREAAE